MGLPTNPYPIGKVTPGASYATVAAQVIEALQTAGYLDDPRVRDLVIQAASTNGATIFITNDGLPPAADYSNVLRELPAGAYYSAGSYVAPNAVDSSKYYVSTQNATDFAFGEVREG